MTLALVLVLSVVAYALLALGTWVWCRSQWDRVRGVAFLAYTPPVVAELGRRLEQALPSPWVLVQWPLHLFVVVMLRHAHRAVDRARKELAEAPFVPPRCTLPGCNEPSHPEGNCAFCRRHCLEVCGPNPDNTERVPS